MAGPLRSLLLGFGIQVDGKEKLDKVDSTVENILKKVERLGTSLATVFLVKGITSFVTDAIEAGRNLALTAEKAGVTTDELERYRYAATMAGVSTEAADLALMRFNRQLGEAELGSKGAAKGIAQVGGGFTAAQLSSMPLGEMLGHLADRMAGLTDKGAKTQLVMKLFGRQGASLIPMLDKGSAGLKKWSDEFDALGGGIGSDFAEKSKEAGAGLKRLDFVFSVLKTRIVADVLPAVEKITLGFTKLLVSLEWLVKHSYTAQTALIALGAVAAWAFTPFLLSILPIVAAMGVLYLIFDDFYTLMMGGRSVMGDFIDALFGKNAHKTFVADVKEKFKEFIDWVKDTAIPFIKDFGKALEWAFTNAIPAIKWLVEKVGEVLTVMKPLLMMATGSDRKDVDAAFREGGIKLFGKTDAEMNAEAKVRRAEEDALNTPGGYSAREPSIPSTSNSSISPPIPQGGGGVSGGPNPNMSAPNFDIDVNISVGQNASTTEIQRAAKDGVTEALTSEDVGHVMRALPWAPGMPIPAPGGG